MDFEAYFYKPPIGESVKLIVRRSAMHSVWAYSFPDVATLNEELWSADVALEDREAICDQLKLGQTVRVPRDLMAEILTLIEKKPFDNSRRPPSDIRSFELRAT